VEAAGWQFDGGGLMATTSIEWTDATWNPVTGCDRVSAGCENCYALTLAARLKAMGNPRYQRDGKPPASGPGFGVTLHPDKLTDPLSWKKPRRVFVNSMSDLFHAEVPDEFIWQVWAVMSSAQQHRFQILTKRPQRMRRLLSQADWADRLEQAAEFVAGRESWCHLDITDDMIWPLPNVWLGVSVESQEVAWRIDWLVRTPAAVRFLSCEPLLGPLDLSRWLWNDEPCTPGLDDGCPDTTREVLNWIIVGGESGVGARLVDSAWVGSIKDQCLDTHIPFFFKQWGGRTPKAGGRLLDGKTWDEFPSVAGVLS
jgi:protein gp37